MEKSKKNRKLILGLVLILLVLICGSVILYFFGDVYSSSTVRDFIKKNSFLLNLSKNLSCYGNKVYHFSFFCVLIFGIIRKKKKIIKLVLIYISVQIIASGLLTEGLKMIVGRPRPGYGFEHEYFTDKISHKSFPSGHASDAMCSAGVLWSFLNSNYLGGIFFIYSMLIALSRVAVGAHYFLDIFIGSAIGFVAGILISYKWM
ncbi:MAG: phosphatase PAP2 family protein [Atribacterota bacterium]